MGRRRRQVLGTVGALAAVLVVGVAVAVAVDAGGSAGSVPDGATTGFAQPASPGWPGATADAPTSESGQGRDAAAVPPVVGEPDPVARAVVRDAALRMEVADPAAAVRDVRAAAAGAGGFLADEHSTDTGASVQVRVPAAGLDALVDRVGGLGTVLERTSTARDVTEQVVDLDARVASGQASVARVRALLAKAETIGEVVSVESELTSREADLDSLERRLAVVRGQVALATLEVSLTARAAPSAGPAGDRTGFVAGLRAGWDRLREAGAAVAAVAGFVLPFLPVVAVLVLVGRPVLRRVRARRVPGRAAPDAP